ncbi:MAG: GNAT family N-acetyltransferase [Phormidesmis sp. CAN_BIN36]|nr:GNAT family N-acetyltransferase [Phormidesmis sp. CAN_BIN36]
MLEITEPQLNQASLCEPILWLLPKWFGIESAIVHYVQEIDHLPTLLAWNQKQVVGFLSIKQHNEFAAEIYVMAVHPQFHQQGIGRQLVETAERELLKLEVEYFQVKTLGFSSPDPNYAKTRKFYESLGFKPLEEFLNLWKGNPCLQMVKRLPPG